MPYGDENKYWGKALREFLEQRALVLEQEDDMCARIDSLEHSVKSLIPTCLPRTVSLIVQVCIRHGVLSTRDAISQIRVGELFRAEHFDAG